MNQEQFVLNYSLQEYNHTRIYLFASDIQICIGICLDDMPFTFVKEQYKTYNFTSHVIYQQIMHQSHLCNVTYVIQAKYQVLHIKLSEIEKWKQNKHLLLIK